MEYKDMNKEELWKEITLLIEMTHYPEENKELFLDCIKEWGARNE